MSADDLQWPGRGLRFKGTLHLNDYSVGGRWVAGCGTCGWSSSTSPTGFYLTPEDGGAALAAHMRERHGR